MAITYIGGAQSVSTANQTTLSPALTVPAHAVDDLIVVWISSDGTSTLTISGTETWSYGSATRQANGVSARMAYAIATGTSAFSPVISSSASEAIVAVCGVFRGVDTTTPIGVSNTANGSTIQSSVSQTTGTTTGSWAVVTHTNDRDRWVTADSGYPSNTTGIFVRETTFQANSAVAGGMAYDTTGAVDSESYTWATISAADGWFADVYELLEGATGNTYQESWPSAGGENASASDTVAAVKTAPGSISEDASGSDAMTEVATMLGSVSEDAGASDAMTEIATMLASISEGATAGPGSWSGGLRYAEAISEDAGAGDSAAAVLTVPVSISEDATPQRRLIDEWPIGYGTGYFVTNEDYWSVGQTFTTDADESGVVTAARFYFEGITDAQYDDSTWTARIYAVTGAPTRPTGSPLATSVELAQNSFGLTFGNWVPITFVFTDGFALSPSTEYAIVAYSDNQPNPHYADVDIRNDNTTVTHAGHGVRYATGAWIQDVSRDVIFSLWCDGDLWGESATMLGSISEEAYARRLFDEYDESNSSGNYDIGAGETNQEIAQRFNSGPGGTVETFDLWGLKLGAPTADITYRIYSDDGGSPAKPDQVLASVTMPYSHVPTGVHTWYATALQYDLAPATYYWFAAESNVAAPGYFRHGADHFSATHDGHLCIRPLAGSWTAEATRAFMFRAHWTGSAMTEVATILGSVSEDASAGETLAAALTALASISDDASGGSTFAGEIASVVIHWAATKIAPGALTEDASAGDTWTEIATLLGAVTEAVSAGDVFSAVATLVASISEDAVADDSVGRTPILHHSITEGATLGEDLAATLLAIAAISEALSAGDTETARLVAAAAISEDASASDAWVESLVGAIQGAISEGASAGDAMAAAMTAVASISEDVSASDIVASLATMVASITEDASLGDSVSGALSISTAITEAAAASDDWAAVVLQIIQGAISSDASASDTFSEILTAVGAISEDADAADSVSAILLMGAAISEAVSAGEQWVGDVVMNVSISEAMTAGDTWAGVTLGAIQGAITEGSTAAATFVAGMTLVASISESASAGDTYAATATLLAQTSDAATLGDVWGAGAVMGVSIVSDALASDDFIGAILKTGAITEGTSADDSWAAILRATGSLAAGATAGSTFESTGGTAGATISEGASFGDSWAGRLALVASILETATLVDLFAAPIVGALLASVKIAAVLAGSTIATKALHGGVEIKTALEATPSIDPKLGGSSSSEPTN